MRSLSFLLTRRWIIFFLIVVLLALLAWRLGVWQFHRLAERQANNAVVRTNEALAPAPVADVLAVDREVADQDEWRVVTATGTYLPEDTVVVRYQGQDGDNGVDIVVPLRTTQGPVLLVNRGFLATDNRSDPTAERAAAPAPPSGTVTIEGYVRSNGTGSSTQYADQSVRAISSATIGVGLGLETYGGFVELKSETPPPAQALVGVELPELNNGPHFFYGLQWWFFAFLALLGFAWMAWEEYTGKATRRRGERETRLLAQQARLAEQARLGEATQARIRAERERTDRS